MKQYVTVALPSGPGSREDAWTSRLNAVAAEGWRLVTINGSTNGHFATFERDV